MALRILKSVVKNPVIIKPHVIAKDISHLNFKKMKDMGFNKIIFDKDNTLTLDRHAEFFSKKIRYKFQEAKDVFGKENTFIVSNMHEDRYHAEKELYEKEF